MARGPRRGDRAAQRKMEKLARYTHSVDPGPSIIEMLEDGLTEACAQYRILQYSDRDQSPTHKSPRRIEARGRVKGLAISLALMRHPLRRYETAWWDYVKKLEQRHLRRADERIASGKYTDAAD